MKMDENAGPSTASILKGAVRRPAHEIDVAQILTARRATHRARNETGSKTRFIKPHCGDYIAVSTPKIYPGRGAVWRL
jgi:hypothetical protein